MSAQTWFNRIWYDGAVPPWWLALGSLAWRRIAGARRRRYLRGLRRPVRLARPVVVVGNLTVGGTGKTPLVLWLTGRLRSLGFAPGIVTRGFGGSARVPQMIDADSDPSVVGDEPALLARRSGARVAVGRDRPAAAQLLIDAGCDVIVSDDGLQHYALARDCEIVVIDGMRGLGNGRLLPAGPLREPAERLTDVDAIVVNGGETPDGVPPAYAAAGGQASFAMRLAAAHAVALRGGATRPLRDFAGSAAHAVAGIGNPQRFFRMLRGFGVAAQGHALDDHARIRGADIRFADRNPVLMTEKDAVKCASLADERHWYVPVEAQFDDADARRLIEIVMRRIAEFKRREGEVSRG